jgi:hypothetical protein
MRLTVLNQMARHLIQRLERMGYQVTRQPQAAA